MASTEIPISPNSASLSSSMNHLQSPMLDTSPRPMGRRIKCWSCVQDHRKCEPSSRNPAVCEYCSKSGYECREDGVGQSKRRVLASMKCSHCREAKQKCEPEVRTWPGEKCRRCFAKGLTCGPPERATRKRARRASGELQEDHEERATSRSSRRRTINAPGSSSPSTVPGMSPQAPSSGASISNSTNDEDYESLKRFSESFDATCPIPGWAVKECFRRLSTFTGLYSIPRSHDFDDESNTYPNIQLWQLVTELEPHTDEILSIATLLTNTLWHQSKDQLAAHLCSATVKLHHASTPRRGQYDVVPMVHRLARFFEDTGDRPKAIRTYQKLLLRHGICDSDIVNRIIELQAAQSQIYSTFVGKMAPSLGCTGAFFSPLHHALDLNIRNPIDNLPVVDFVISALENPIVSISRRDKNNSTVLHRAASLNNPQLISACVKHGASLVDINGNSRTPLEVAVKKGCYDAVEEILECGSRLPLGKRSKLEDSIFVAIAQKNPKIASLLIDYLENTERWAERNIESGPELLYHAAFNGMLEVVERLSEVVPVNFTINNAARYSSPLTAALRGGHLEVVKELLAGGADPDMYGALYCAIKTGKRSLVDLLIYHKANTNTSSFVSAPLFGTAGLSESRLTPVQYSVSFGLVDITDLLLRQPGVDVNSSPPGPGAYTALQLACKNRYVETVKLLLNAGARTNGFSTIVHEPTTPELSQQLRLTRQTTLRLAQESQNQEIFDMIQEAAIREEATDDDSDDAGSVAQYESQEHEEAPDMLQVFLGTAGYSGIPRRTAVDQLIFQPDWRTSHVREDMRS